MENRVEKEKIAIKKKIAKLQSRQNTLFAKRNLTYSEDQEIELLYRDISLLKHDLELLESLSKED